MLVSLTRSSQNCILLTSLKSPRGGSMWASGREGAGLTWGLGGGAFCSWCGRSNAYIGLRTSVEAAFIHWFLALSSPHFLRSIEFGYCPQVSHGTLSKGDNVRLGIGERYNNEQKGCVRYEAWSVIYSLDHTGAWEGTCLNNQINL